MTKLAAVLSFAFALGVAACGLVVSFDDFGTTRRRTTPEAGVAATLYSVHGVASGLDGKKVTLLLDGQPLEVGEGAFVFPSALADGERYEVTVRENPSGLSCSVDKGTGTVEGADVSGVLVHCASTDALLANLTVSGLPLSPAFAPGVFYYQAETRVFDVFTASPPSLTITATTSHPDAVVTVAGLLATSGKPSAPITLKLGPNPILIVVLAPDQRQLHYTVLINVKVCDYFKPADNTPPAWDTPQPAPPTGPPGPPLGWPTIPDPQAPPAFGTAVAISGDTMAVGSSKLVHVFRRTGNAWSQEALLRPDMPQDIYGVALALASDTIVVGATSYFGTGAAYVFTRSGTTWTQEAYLTTSNATERSPFGQSVAVSGDTVAVRGAGLINVFVRTGSIWSQEAVVTPPAPQTSAVGSIALSGDTLVSTSSGGVYVFTRSGSTWSQQAYVEASKPLGAIALSDDTFAVAAPTDSSAATGINGDENDTSADGAGAVYVFTRSGSTWSRQAYVKASNTRSVAYFGSSVALAGDTLAVSSFYESGGAMGVDGDQTSVSSPRSGAVYRFVRNGTSWSQQAYVKASNTSPDAQFGASLGLSGVLLVVGSPGERSIATGINGDETIVPSNPKLGAAYVF